MFDACANGQTLKCLTVVDEWTRESLAIDVAGGIRSGRVIEVLTQLVSVHGAPRYLRSDNGPEFVAGAILRWLLQAQIETALIEPGKPWQNATDESFNGKFRDEYLSLQWFRNRVDAKVGIEQWRRHYNDVRPHSSLGYLTPAEFKAQLRAGSDDGGRSPAMPAHADQEEHQSDLTMPTGAVLPVVRRKPAGQRSVSSAPRLWPTSAAPNRPSCFWNPCATTPKAWSAPHGANNAPRVLTCAACWLTTPVAQRPPATPSSEP